MWRGPWTCLSTWLGQTLCHLRKTAHRTCCGSLVLCVPDDEPGDAGVFASVARAGQGASSDPPPALAQPLGWPARSRPSSGPPGRNAMSLLCFPFGESLWQREGKETREGGGVTRGSKSREWLGRGGTHGHPLPLPPPEGLRTAQEAGWQPIQSLPGWGAYPDTAGVSREGVLSPGASWASPAPAVFSLEDL